MHSFVNKLWQIGRMQEGIRDHECGYLCASQRNVVCPKPGHGASNLFIVVLFDCILENETQLSRTVTSISHQRQSVLILQYDIHPATLQTSCTHMMRWTRIKPLMYVGGGAVNGWRLLQECRWRKLNNAEWCACSTVGGCCRRLLVVNARYCTPRKVLQMYVHKYACKQLMCSAARVIVLSVAITSS